MYRLTSVVLVAATLFVVPLAGQAQEARADSRSHLADAKQPAVDRKAKKVEARKGKASFYHRRFVGRRTASGQRYDPKKLTAAHRSLPLGSEVKVTNVDNGKAVVVTINDRGPHKRGRIIDLSRAAAQRLDMVSEGLAVWSCSRSPRDRGIRTAGEP